MSLIQRFLGIPDPDRSLTALAANQAIEKPLSLDVLFPNRFDFDGDAIAEALRSLDPVLAKARAETLRLDDDSPAKQAGDMIGLAGWGPHVLKMIYSDAPIPPALYEASVRFANFDPQLKDDAAGHKANVIISYAGEEGDPLEQYVALATLAGALSRLGAILIINEPARAAFPAEAMLAFEPEEGIVASLRVMPIPLLYGGFVKIEVENQSGVWMRTFGNHLLGLPNLAMHAKGHRDGNEVFDLFANILFYCRRAKVEFPAGAEVQISPGLVYLFRERTDAEWWLESEGMMLVMERIPG